MDMPVQSRFLTAREVSEKFFGGRLPYSRILTMTKTGELPGMKQGKSYIYSLAALEEWEKKRMVKPAWANTRR